MLRELRVEAFRSPRAARHMLPWNDFDHAQSLGGDDVQPLHAFEDVEQRRKATRPPADDESPATTSCWASAGRSRARDGEHVVCEDRR